MLNEKKVLDELTRRRLPCQHRVQIGHFEVDILVGCKIAVEVDGYYHALKDKVALDASKDKHLESLGYAVLRITAGEVKTKGVYGNLGPGWRGTIKMSASAAGGSLAPL